MGNKPLSAAFWAQLGRTTAGPCRTCAHFTAWDVRRGYPGGPVLVFALCALRGICHQPEEGCEKWEREPGADDE